MDYSPILILGALGFTVALVLTGIHCFPGFESVHSGNGACEDPKQNPENISAVIYCAGGNNCSDKYAYQGVETCFAASKIFRGKKECIYGCIGFGDCAQACAEGAISHVKGEIPAVNKNTCTGCGLCVSACPKKIISLVPSKYDVHIKCSSLNAGRYVREICATGCISCGICVKICPTKAIKIENNLAVVNYNKCSNCGLCVERCPANTIERILPVV
ncbi:MAG: 4Fe-4S binding protein [Elusimicrobia bacterium]|nr:4Fe-4S binding protein [Elusimicrobiota bacterium]MBU2615241.1 4Fe-4S binding protein [Elusimicrobiota bacterium]